MISRGAYVWLTALFNARSKKRGLNAGMAMLTRGSEFTAGSQAVRARSQKRALDTAKNH
jgi:GH18 family chitinase